MACLFAILFAFYTFLSSTVAFSAPQSDTAGAKQTVYSDREGYAVLSVLLDQASSKAKLSAIDISIATVPEGEILSSAKCLKVSEDFESAVRDFQERNKSRLRLIDQFSLKVNFRLAEKPDVRSYPQAAGEQQLEEKFVARVFFAASVVGFDQNKTHAIAYVHAYRGEMCAGGAYHLLVKDKQGWKEIPGSPKCEWMSQEQDTASPRRTS